jgi:hypothetical protein
MVDFRPFLRSSCGYAESRSLWVLPMVDFQPFISRTGYEGCLFLGILQPPFRTHHLRTPGNSLLDSLGLESATMMAVLCFSQFAQESNQPCLVIGSREVVAQDLVS